MSMPYAGMPSAMRNASKTCAAHRVAPAVRRYFHSLPSCASGPKARSARPAPVVADQAQVHAVPLHAGAGHGLRKHRQAHRASTSSAAGPVSPSAASPLSGTSSTSSMMMKRSSARAGARTDRRRSRVSSVSPSRQTVRSPWMRPCALSTRFHAPAFGQVVHHVGDHAAEPAEAVFSAHGHAAQPAQVVARGFRTPGRLFPRRARLTASGVSTPR
jgi:hypothetical protein